MDLVQRLGAFAGQLTLAQDGVIRAIAIDYEGAGGGPEPEAADGGRPWRGC